MQSIKSLLKRINSSRDDAMATPPELKDDSESEQSTSSRGGSFRLKGGSARLLTTLTGGSSPQSTSSSPVGAAAALAAANGGVGGGESPLNKHQVFPSSRKVRSSENLVRSKSNSVKLTSTSSKTNHSRKPTKTDLKTLANSSNNVAEEKVDGEEDGEKQKKSKKGKVQLKEYLESPIPDASSVLLQQTLPRIIENPNWDLQQQVLVMKIRACKVCLEFKTEIEIRPSTTIETFAAISEEAKATFAASASSQKKKSPSAAKSPSRLSHQADMSVSVVSNQSDENANMKAMKKRKTEYLLEITEFFAFAPLWFNLENGKELFSMICVNIFRTFPATPYEKLLLASENSAGAPHDDSALSNQVFQDPSMVHLIPVYQIFLRVVSCPDIETSLLKKLISRPFVERLCENFLSEDQREREMVKSIVHKIYGKFNTYRTFIRKVFQNQFLEFIYETDHHPGAAEILEILASIISGFAVPLRKEHKHFLTNTLLPLIQCSKLAEFQTELVACFSEFITKEPMFAKDILIGIASKWPISGHAAKQVAFVELMDSILQITTSECFKETIPHTVPIIAKCIGSQSVLVCERTLCLWSQEYICQLFFANRNAVLPMVFPALSDNAQNHWAQPIKDLSEHILNAFREFDKKLYGSCAEQLRKTMNPEIKTQ